MTTDLAEPHQLDTSGEPGRFVVHARDVHVRRGAVDVLAGVDLDVRAGQVHALLGPNGAGKTTLVECLEGYAPVDSGRLEVLGRDPWRAPPAWRARVGAVLQDSRTDADLTVSEYVSMTAGYYPDPLGVQEVLELVGLEELARRRVHRLSGGERRRLDLALALVGRPELVFLDEPTTGFDPQARRGLWELLQRMRGTGTAMLLTTHYLDEVEVLADTVTVLIAGRVRSTGTVQEMRHRAGLPSRVTMLAADGSGLHRLPGVLSVRQDGLTGRWELSTHDPAAVLAALPTAFAGQAFPPVDVSVRSPDLEDVYLDLLDRSTTNPEA